MNRTDITNDLAKSDAVESKEQAKKVMDVITKTILKGLAEEGRVHITGLGTLEAEPRASRMVRNPATGQKVRSKKSVRTRFRASTSMKEVLTGRKKVPGITPRRPSDV